MDLNTILMLAIFSVIVGVLIGSVGIGGVLLLPILTYLFKIEIHVALSSAMIGCIFSGLVGVIIYGQEGSIKWNMALWLIVGGMPGAFLGSSIANNISNEGLELIIGLFVLFAGARALKRPTKTNQSKAITGSIVLIFIGFFTGAGSAISGTGGPLVLIPIMVSLKIAAHTAVGLSQAIQLPVASLATFGNFLYGTIDYHIAGTISGGLAIGGAIGAKIAHLISAIKMSLMVSWVLLFVGVVILFKLCFNYFLYG